jgi:hypothetical protein
VLCMKVKKERNTIFIVKALRWYDLPHGSYFLPVEAYQGCSNPQGRWYFASMT